MRKTFCCSCISRLSSLSIEMGGWVMGVDRLQVIEREGDINVVPVSPRGRERRGGAYAARGVVLD